MDLLAQIRAYDPELASQVGLLAWAQDRALEGKDVYIKILEERLLLMSGLPPDAPQ